MDAPKITNNNSQSKFQYHVIGTKIWSVFFLHLCPKSDDNLTFNELWLLHQDEVLNTIVIHIGEINEWQLSHSRFFYKRLSKYQCKCNLHQCTINWCTLVSSDESPWRQLYESRGDEALIIDDSDRNRFCYLLYIKNQVLFQ